MNPKGPAKAAPIRILIVDDHPLVRKALRQLIDEEPDMVICAEAEDAADALRAAEKTHPHVAVVDLSLKESSGLDFIKDMQIRLPRVRLLVLSMHPESLYAERVLRAGARGYITKEEGTEKVVAGIRAVAEGRIYLSDGMREKVLQKVAGAASVSLSPMDRLSDRELQVFEMIGQGLPTRQIAETLHVSVKTVESHRENIKAKLGVQNAPQLMQQAVQWVQSARGV